MRNRKRKNKVSVSGKPREGYLSADYNEAKVTTSNFKHHFLSQYQALPAKNLLLWGSFSLSGKKQSPKHNPTLRGS